MHQTIPYQSDLKHQGASILSIIFRCDDLFNCNGMEIWRWYMFVECNKIIECLL